MRIDYVDMIQSYFLISILNSIFCKVDIAVDIVKGRFEKKEEDGPVILRVPLNVLRL